jgi:hypothetical protein
MLAIEREVTNVSHCYWPVGYDITPTQRFWQDRVTSLLHGCLPDRRHVRTFRHFFAVPSANDTNGQEIGAVHIVLASVMSMIEK